MSKAWDAARADCISKGGNLTSITSANENSLVLKTSKEDAWIGLNDRDVENTFVWIDGTNNTYTNWENDEPDSNRNCIIIKSDGTWKDKDCGESYPYVCKYELTLPTYTTQNPTNLSATTSATTSVVTSDVALTS